jgi:mRNA interferase HigB
MGPSPEAARVKVVGRERIEDFCNANPDATSRMHAWLMEAERADWRTPQDVKNRYATASFLGANRVVFNIGGSRFRLLTKVAYKTGIVLIERVGTHEEYDTWDL